MVACQAWTYPRSANSLGSEPNLVRKNAKARVPNMVIPSNLYSEGFGGSEVWHDHCSCPRDEYSLSQVVLCAYPIEP